MSTRHDLTESNDCQRCACTMHIASCTWIFSRPSLSMIHLTDTMERKSDGRNIPAVENEM